MTKRFISELQENEKVREIFLLADKQLRQNRNGNLYLLLKLADRSGNLTAMMWNANEDVALAAEVGDYVRVEGSTQLYNGVLQMIATRWERVPEKEVEEADYVRVSRLSLETLREALVQSLRSIRNPFLKELSEAFLIDDHFMEQFCKAPAAIKNHHAYIGGLLEHVVSLMRLADVIAQHYPQVNRDLLVFASFLHDVGKIEELSYEREFAYTDEGQLVGHLVLGVEILHRKIEEAERISGRSIPPSLVTQLKHLILSHHGKYEFGSPKLPMTLESFALHALDDLDAKMSYVMQAMGEDANAESPWTPFHATLNRKLFKGPPEW